MNATDLSRHASLLLAICVGASHGAHGLAQNQPPPKAGVELSTPELEAQQRKDQRRQFQSQELITAKPATWIFKPGDTPRIVWRDVEAVERLGCDSRLRVRWFDANLNESPVPKEPGRWLAWIEGAAPNGTPLRRTFTFYAMPKGLSSSYVPDLTVTFPRFPGPNAPVAVQEHQAEVSRLANDLLLRTLMDNEKAAILIAGLAEFKPLGHPARFVESAAVLNDDYHLALKLKLQGRQHRALQPPRRRVPPATVLHEGSLAAAGMNPDAKTKIDEVCRAWAEDAAEPFVTLVARRGVIVTHEAFGPAPSGEPISRDYRCWVASITKTVTALLFSQFLDQHLIALDDSLSAVFPDYPKNDRHVPTFRQCFNHTSGLSGHGDFGGMRNPHLENVILNGIDVNEPNIKYAYSGLGFELAAKAMELVAGKSAVRLYHDHLFQPLGFGDVPIGNASSDGEFTAMELGILGQWIANRGSYGPWEFIAPQTFDQLLPKPLRVPDHGFVEDEGIGLHWIRHVKPGAPRNSKRAEDLLFSPRTVGHGSFSGCIFLVDPEQELIITQVRKQSGPRSAEWSTRFYQTIAATVEDDRTEGKCFVEP
ncbi:MAG: beta-lactamase family protein [Planctomycetes bacterium]|nr:beta-lactamase family protein [Planctomycetota bacterium]MBL7038623.1 beta-lactamase family protein [Pirellulaceae bacterium]